MTYKVPPCFNPTPFTMKVVNDYRFQLVTDFVTPAKTIKEYHANRLGLDVEKFQAIVDFIAAKENANAV
jgi:hypothetical protein